jgi:hypothetical protein
LFASASPPPQRAYACEPDPTRAPGIDRCVMVCEATTDCDPGTVCSGGYCVEGALPRNECVLGVQRYQLRASEAFTVSGTQSGYLHPIIEDEATGACVADPAAHPLLVGRIPLTAPPCEGDGYTDVTPNPCSTTVTHTETLPRYPSAPTSCANPQTSLRTRDAPAIRFRNPMMTFHLTDPYYQGDAVCREDRAGTLGLIPTVHAGFRIELLIEAGFRTLRLAGAAAFPVNVVLGPEDSIWVIDEGDHVPQSSNAASTRGQVYRYDPGNLAMLNLVQ